MAGTIESSKYSGVPSRSTALYKNMCINKAKAIMAMPYSARSLIRPREVISAIDFKVIPHVARWKITSFDNNGAIEYVDEITGTSLDIQVDYDVEDLLGFQQSSWTLVTTPNQDIFVEKMICSEINHTLGRATFVLDGKYFVRKKIKFRVRPQGNKL